VLVIDKQDWKLVKAIPVPGQPVFVMARRTGGKFGSISPCPTTTITIIDVKDLSLGKTDACKAVLHMEFTPRGEQVWVAVRDDNQLVIYDTTLCRKSHAAAQNQRNFFSSRAHKTGL